MDNVPVLPIIWLIDEDVDELPTWVNALKTEMPRDAVEIRGQSPYRSLREYLSLLANPQTACIITDQRLKVSGLATYTGIELAQFVRGINSKLPVYVLTNYPEEDMFHGLEWSVEDIIDKHLLTQPEGLKIVAARIIRRIDTYKDILDRRSERMQVLVNKSSQGILSEPELEELENLGLQKSSPVLAEELAQVRQIEELIEAHEGLMRKLEEFAPETDSEAEDSNGK